MKSLFLVLLWALAISMAAASASTLVDHNVVHSSGFLRDHPDLRYQLSGQGAMEIGNASKAFEEFRRASRYGNKLTQAMVAEMYWIGRGVPQDRALGYAWMDLAAERGHVALIGLRERYWEALDEADRDRAINEGQAIYAEFGDAVAKPRLEALLERGRAEASGSRVGARMSAVKVYMAPRMSPLDTDFSLDRMRVQGTRTVTYYDERYWQPRAYWQWQNQLLDQLPRGAVTVLPVTPDD